MKSNILALVAVAGICSTGSIAADAATHRAVLATPDQLAAELRALKAVRQPIVIAAQGRVRETLLADPAAATGEGKALLDHAITLLTFSLAMREIAGDTSRPLILWDNEDTPHSWYGRTIPGLGVSGDNPDNIYRGSTIDGAGRYEIEGHVPPNGPAQFSIEATAGEPGKPGLKTLDKGHADMGAQLGMLRDKDIVVDANGDFTIAVDGAPAAGRPNHLQVKPGPVSIIYRNSLSDWRQVPTSFAIRRIDDRIPTAPIDDQELARRIAADLPGWIGFWMTFKNGWLGKPAVNTLVGPLPRDGGWGYLAGGTYALRDNEAIVATVSNGGALYTGLQVFDPWALAADARRHFNSLNNSQAKPNADGSVTYVIASRDPGVANWIDTAGLHAGGILFRWQQLPAGGAPHVIDYRVVKRTDLKAALPQGGIPVTPEQRASDLHGRAASYELRLTN